MFSVLGRYVTRGVNAEIDITLQLVMWNMIDELIKRKIVEVDYLQVFKIKRYRNHIIIEHSQECPDYKEVYTIETKNTEFNGEKKIFIIDSGDYSTMLLAEEY